jgi:hypothetical protein
MSPKTKFAVWAILITSTGVGAAWPSAPVLFQSRESKTLAGGPVFNRVAYLREGGRDVWMMHQSHAGPHVPGSQWDRLAIVVENQGGHRTAKFYQLEPGPLTWNPAPKTVPQPRAACYMCHSNGPRLMRPEAGLGFMDRVTLTIWNSRIRGYGRVVPDPVTSLKFSGRAANRPLVTAPSFAALATSPP